MNKIILICINIPIKVYQCSSPFKTRTSTYRVEFSNLGPFLCAIRIVWPHSLSRRFKLYLVSLTAAVEHCYLRWTLLKKSSQCRECEQLPFSIILEELIVNFLFNDRKLHIVNHFVIHFLRCLGVQSSIAFTFILNISSYFMYLICRFHP